jgi:hypothetical protein
MDDNQLDIYRRAYSEHISRRNMRRVLPAPGNNNNTTKYRNEIGDIDHQLQLWFLGKCEQDITWCT